MRSHLAAAVAVLALAACTSGGSSSSSSGTTTAGTSSSGTVGGSASTVTSSSSSSSSSASSSSSSTTTTAASSTASSSSSSAASTASSSSSAAASSGSSSAASTTGTSASSTAGSSSGSSGTSTSTAGSSSGGTTGTPQLSFHQFCQQAGPALCAQQDTCLLADSNASTSECAEILTWQYFGCSGDTEAAVNAGTELFDPAAGQACLDAIAASGCTGDDLAAAAAACAGIVVGNVPLGGACGSSSDCVLPTGWPANSLRGGVPGCTVNGGSSNGGLDAAQQPASQIGGCQLGTCAAGGNVGDPCNTYQQGMGCTDSECVFISFFPDAGFAQSEYCVPFAAASGGACTPYSADCDDQLGYCGDLQDGGSGSCLPFAGLGGSCQATNCYSAGEPDCACARDEFCQSADAGPGLCTQRLQVGDLCDPTQYAACPDASNGCQSFALADGGLVSRCSGEQVALGGFCDPDENVNCGGFMSCNSLDEGTCVNQRGPGESCDPVYNLPGCAYPLMCVAADGGSGSCQALGALGDPCLSVNCLQLLTCDYIPDDGGAICDALHGVGFPCDVNRYDQCADGFCGTLADGGAACTAFALDGQSCDASQVQDSCENSASCVSDGSGGFSCQAYCGGT